MTIDTKIRERTVRETLRLLNELSSQSIIEADYRAVDIFIDLRTAIIKADLSERQLDVISLLYTEGMTLQQVGERYGITKQAIYKTETSAISEIARHMKGEIMQWP